MGRVLQSPRRPIALFVLGWVCVVGWAAAEVVIDPRPRLTHPAIWWTALWMVAYWATASGAMLTLPAADWLSASWRRTALRVWWLLGWLTYLVHVAAAFHLGHEWSHAAAVRHTERTAGVGEGIFVNYLFGLVWGVDAVWLAGWPDRYARRPRWVGWAIHGFLAFITFNATVVYGTGVARWGGVIAFATLGWLLVRRRPGR